MRKLLHKIGKAALSLTFLCAATAASASAVDSLVSISPDPADTLTSKTFDVTFTFSGQVTYDSVYVKSGSVENKFAVSATASETATVSVLESYWSDDVTAGLNMISVSLVGVKDSDGNYINYSSGTDGVVATSFRILATNVATAKYVGCDTDPDWTYANDLVDFPVTFIFSDEVTMSNTDTVAIIKYSDGDNFVETKVLPSDSLYADWMPRSNYYGISLCVPTPNNYGWDELSYITISFYGLKSNGVLVNISDPLITFYTGSLEEDTESLNYSKKTIEGIQTTQGLVISKTAEKSTIESLKSGIYIVNGKLVYIK